MTATIRPARPDEAESLSALALRSKGHWGYSNEFLEACRAELSYSKTDVASAARWFCVVEIDRTAVGFYALVRLDRTELELDALFVEPSHIGKGLGRLLIEHAKRQARELGAMRLVIQGDPNAERFYLAAGGVLVGTKESASIPGRLLPLFAIELADR